LFDYITFEVDTELLNKPKRKETKLVIIIKRTPWDRVILKNLKIAQMIMNFPAVI
jgi:hypothetical protein